MGRQDEKFLMILDIDKVLTADELDVVQRTGELTFGSVASGPVVPFFIKYLKFGSMPFSIM